MSMLGSLEIVDGLELFAVLYGVYVALMSL